MMIHASRSLRLAALALTLALLLAAPGLAAPSDQVRTELTMEKSFLDGSQNVNMQFTMTNFGHRALRVLSWNTPFDGNEGNFFQVARNGVEVPYLGRVYKRGTPQASDFFTLAPGESRSTAVELSAFYAMNYTGEYIVRFRGESFDHAPLDRHDLDKAGRVDFLDLRSNEVVFWIEGEEPPMAGLPTPFAGFEKARGGGGGGGAKESCDNTQKAILADALVEAQAIAANAANYLGGGHNANSARYTEWFGTYSSSRWNTVDGNFQAISDALDNAPIEFDCKCKQQYYAYVYSNQPYKIYLCRVFWQAPLTGTDSKAGTLVHEMSHFDVVAGTDDVTYGQNSCRSLADSNPDSAIRNADSHEYFAENTPFLN